MAYHRLAEKSQSKMVALGLEQFRAKQRKQ
jgi:hypothetical protein